MAVEDVGGRIAGKPVEVLAADDQNKADIGLQTARAWFDVDGVDMIVDVPNSAVVLAVQQLAKEKNRVLIVSAGRPRGPHRQGLLSDRHPLDLGHLCGRGEHGAGRSLKRAATAGSFLTADYAFGHAMERDVSRVVTGSLEARSSNPSSTR